MQQLSGLDAAFVQQDSDRTPMHMTVMLIYDTGQVNSKQISREQLKQLVEERLAGFPLFHRRLLKVPMGMDKPYWVDVQRPKWSTHIHHSVLADASDGSALQSILGRIHGKRMDLSAPLWEMHLLHNLQNLPGLDGHYQAVVIKIHHCAVDGVSMAAIVNALHQPPDESRARRKKPAKAPGHMELWTLANLNNIARQFKLIETARKVLPGVLRQAQQENDMAEISGTGSRFNATVKAGRCCGAIVMSKAKIKRIKRNARHVTLNDIALCCVAGALRSYLDFHGELPAKSLAAGVPVNVRGREQYNAEGNRIVTMIVGLATNVDDPVERLRLIHRFAVQGKKQTRQLGADSMQDISDSLAPALLAEGIRTLSWASRASILPVPFHTMISNVPGPSGPLSLDGAKLVVPIGFGPLRDNNGLFHVVCNSQDLMSLSFNACRQLLPDPEFYQQCLQQAYADLCDAAL